MASPQLEHGGLNIADELLSAICRFKFTGNHLKVLLSVMQMTYRVGQTKAQISIDDLRYSTQEKKYLVEKAVQELIQMGVLFQQDLNEEMFLLGIQKDWEKWHSLSVVPKTGNIINNKYIYKDSKEYIYTLPKTGKTPPDRLLEEIHRRLAIPFQVGRWKRERSSAVALYKQALNLAHSPVPAIEAIYDYFNFLDNPSFRMAVDMPLTKMLDGFGRYFRQCPAKPKRIKLQEDLTERRWFYDPKRGVWRPSNQRIKK